MTKNYKHNIASIIIVGFPFVIYKAILGHIIYMLFPANFNLIAFLFWGLAIIDIIINTLNLISLIILRSPITDMCFFAFLFNLINKKHHQNTEIWYQIGTSFDLLLSFSIVALVVGLNLFRFLFPMEIYFWNIATVFNVLGAGFFQMKNTISSLNEK